ncbi:MAG: hypothetical protein JXQ30_07495 [Spirochaetes bacterium]|nr:hypothetical protein [Spirochaetota bacterium]
MIQDDRFDILILLGRPASGKSEIIDFLRRTEPAERIRRFHIGEFEVIDDFPMLWAWFEEDRLLENMGHERLHTATDGYFNKPYLWDLLIKRIGLEYEKRITRDPRYHDKYTALVEFSRGSEHGGYGRAFANLDTRLLGRAAVLYVDVSFDESLRKNRKRYDPKDPGSILRHSLPDEKLRRLYGDTDWEDLAEADSGNIDLNGVTVPYAVFGNEDDVTTKGGAALGDRLEETCMRLWKIYMEHSTG